MNMRAILTLALLAILARAAQAQTTNGQFIEITSLPRSQAVYRVAANPAPLPLGYAAPLPRYEGQPITAYRGPVVAQTAYAPVTAYQPVASAPLQPVPGAVYSSPYCGSMPPNCMPAYGAGGQAPPLRPIISLSGPPTNGIVGQGIIGQPKLYMPNQPVRNLLRYITP